MSYKWDLTTIYKNREEFDRDFESVKNEILPTLGTFKGKLSDLEELKKFLSLQRDLIYKLSKLGMFASMQSDLDKTNVPNIELLSNVSFLYAETNSVLSFTDPELLTLGKEKLDKFINDNPDYADYAFSFEKLFRGSKFIKLPNEEMLISNYSTLSDAGSTLYSQLSVADNVPTKVTLTDGREVEVSQSNWTTLCANEKLQEDRRRIFETLYQYYSDRKSTYGEIYNTVMQAELANMKSRGYSSILQSHVYNNNIPEEVFLNLIDVASNNNKALRKYLELRRKYLKVEKYRTFDRFCTLAESTKSYTYDEAKDIFFKSIEDFPEDFKNKAKEVLKEGYVDVYNNVGKRTGAYSSGGDNIHPFILLNYNGELDDIFTVAHEAGHSIHTLYSMEAQPLLTQGYTIFVAEIASTFNEHNLLDYLMKFGTLSKNDKIALLQKSIDQIVSTFHRQTLFAHYEYLVSKKIEAGEPINYQVLCGIMKDLYDKYYGIDLEEEQLKKFVWAYIPHLFYTPFYVYQYATSFTASMLIYQNVKDKKKGAFDNYIKMLKAGGSDYPINEVKLAGVDLTKKETFFSVIDRMEVLVDQLERLLEE